MWITVPIVCCVEDIEYDEIAKANVILESLNLSLKELPPVRTEIRQGELNTNMMVCYYPSNDGTKTVVECVNQDYSIALSLPDFRLRVNQALNLNG